MYPKVCPTPTPQTNGRIIRYGNSQSGRDEYKERSEREKKTIFRIRDPDLGFYDKKIKLKIKNANILGQKMLHKTSNLSSIFELSFQEENE
jgi:hypothetical protein